MKTPAARYGLAAAAAGLGFLLREAITAWVGPGLPTFITFYPAVMVGALLGGFGPGLAATALSAAMVAEWVLQPGGSLRAASPVDRVSLILFGGMGLFMSAVAELYRRHRRKAAAYDRAEALRESAEKLKRLNTELQEANVSLLEARGAAVKLMDESVTARQRAEQASRELRQEAAERRETEERLRQSEAGLRQALEAGQVFTFEWDPASDAVLRSPNCASILGWESDATRDTGQGYFAAVHPEDRESFVRLVSHLTAQRPTYIATYRYARPGDGKEVVLEETGRADFDDSGRMTRLRGLTRDVTERRRAEEALRESEARLKLAQVSAGAGMWDWNLSTGKLNWSGELYRLFGLDPDSDRTSLDVWARLLHPDDRLSAEKRIKAAIESRTALDNEYRILLPSRRVRWINALGHAIYDAGGKPLRMSGICIDITHRKETEAALRESESFYRQTIESIPGMVFTTRPDGFCDFQSQQWVEFTGVPMSEHLGDGWSSLLHPEDRPRAYAAWRNAVEGRAPYDLEYRVRRHDGAYEWFKVRGRPIRNAAGEIDRWFGTALNIDDLVKARTALERSERLYRAIGESIDYGIWICEPDGRNAYASESFLRLVGLTQKQCSDFGWGAVLHPEDAERTLAAWKECVRTGGLWDTEHRFKGTNGQWHPILARGVPVKDDQDRVMCWAGINLDISRLKRAEEDLRASLREKEALLQEVHHRVKNNLQVISSLINLQADALDQPALRAVLADVRDRVRTMALVHEKLYQSESTARLDFAEYLGGLLDYLWRAHGAVAGRVRLTLATEPVILPADLAVPCGLILNELASNALKHAFPGQAQGEVTVGLSCDAAAGQVLLRVSDNGRGLSPGADWRQSRSLGLKLVQILARQIRGSIEVGPGPGADFRLTFPIPGPK